MPRFLGPIPVGSKQGGRACLDTWILCQFGTVCGSWECISYLAPSQLQSMLEMHLPLGQALTVLLPVGTVGIQLCE